MRKFSSYGPVSTKQHYYVPREELIERVRMQLLGENHDEGGHYITIWGPRQTGKTWALFQAFHRLRKDKHFDVISIGVEAMKMEEDIDEESRKKYEADFDDEETKVKVEPIFMEIGN
jgi:predicted AAA+ superfamily ATPase